MYWIIDIEWVDKDKSISITQIAAMCIDTEMNIVDTKYLRIRPNKATESDWFHPAFSGGTREQFLHAPSWDEARKTIRTWFKEGDVLIWWHPEPLRVFRSVLLAEDFPNLTMVAVHSRIKRSMANSNIKKGSPYQLAKSIGLNCPVEEHYSLNDVNVIYGLLTSLSINLGSLLEKEIALDYEEGKEASNASASGSTNAQKKKKHRRKSSFDPRSTFAYVLDLHNQVFHRSDCGFLPILADKLKGFATIKGCLKQGASPCFCCEAETLLYLQKTKSTKTALYYSTKSSGKVVHHHSCSILKRIETDSQAYFMSIEEAHQAGFRWCELCNPLKKLYRSELGDLLSLCNERHLQCSFREDTLYVTSRHDFWRIIMNSFTGKLVLYHRNKYQSHNSSMTYLYHQQKHHEETLLAYAIYIANHDDYIDQKEEDAKKVAKRSRENKLPSSRSKNGRKKMRLLKEKQQKREISRVLSLIEELEEADM